MLPTVKFDSSLLATQLHSKLLWNSQSQGWWSIHNSPQNMTSTMSDQLLYDVMLAKCN